jgi:hypothetical protein
VMTRADSPDLAVANVSHTVTNLDGDHHRLRPARQGDRNGVGEDNKHQNQAVTA